MSISSRVFNNGNSQAVRIPHAFRLDTSEVEISQAANGDLIIHPLPRKRGDFLLAALDGFDDDFIEALEQDKKSQLLMQDRASL